METRKQTPCRETLKRCLLRMCGAERDAFHNGVCSLPPLLKDTWAPGTPVLADTSTTPSLPSVGGWRPPYDLRLDLGAEVFQGLHGGLFSCGATPFRTDSVLLTGIK